jgi:carbonic anhydrase
MERAIRELLHNHDRYAAEFPWPELSAPPRLRVAILTCMDARIDPARVLGLEPGDAHVIRNGGGIVTEDALRSLAISQHYLGTEEILVIQHTRCGLLGLDEDEFTRRVEASTGTRPPWPAGGFGDLEASVRDGVRRIRASGVLPHTDHIRGFVYEVETGRVREVD